MRRLIVLIILVFPLTLFACEAPCNLNSMEVFLPEDQRSPAANIYIEKLVYQTESGDVSQKIAIDELMRLKDALNMISIASFKHSKTTFEVLAQVQLTPSATMVFKLQTTGGDNEEAMLLHFHNEAEKLNSFKAKEDKVFVFVHYKISAVAGE